MYLFLSHSISKSKEWLKPTSASTLRRMIDWDIQEELSALFVTNSPLFPCFLFIYAVRLKSAASVDTCQRYIRLILSLGMCNLQWRPHTLPGLLGDGRGHAGRWITNIAVDLSSIRAAVFFAKLEFLSSGCTWQCSNLSLSCCQFAICSKSAAEFAGAFQEVLSQGWGSFCQQQAAALLCGSGWKISVRCHAGKSSASWLTLFEYKLGDKKCWFCIILNAKMIWEISTQRTRFIA